MSERNNSMPFVGTIPDRDEAWALLCEWTESDALRGHALAVEATMRAYARKYAEPEELWGAIGLLHDFDYERYPESEDHPAKGAQELRSRGYDADFIAAIMSHADYTGVPRETLAAKVLFAVDELCGLVVATALVMPGKALAEVTAKSVRKKMKSKGFARKVSREDIVTGADELGVDLIEHIGVVIEALQGAADRLGL
jgi:putative nucleotidyltransferase with HDIG domain